jgi:uncharacterized LabA/DUF88 family protein
MMDRIAVFVDSGYLFAQGSAAVSREKKSRTSIYLDAEKAIAALKAVATDKAPRRELLRIYWYDGAIGGARPTSEQALLAALDDVKLRLGFVNSHGQQKGVDSLIVTDLIELARLKSITDALLLSGDEDVRVGVQIAQNYGIRVHLLGIHPARGSQSLQLMQEADTTSEWGADTVTKFMGIRPAVQTELPLPSASTVPAIQSDPDNNSLIVIADTVDDFVRELVETDLTAIQAYWKTERGVPPDVDRRLLPICGKSVGRKLEIAEIKHMRSCFQRVVRGRLDHSEVTGAMKI